MPYPNKRGGGGGGARSPVVVSGSPFADAAALEAWSVLNPSELVNNDTNYATAMAGGASYEWRGSNGVYSTGSWFRQNALTVIEQQNVDSITGLTLATVPVKGAQGLSDSIATQTGMSQIMVDGELGTTKDTVVVGQGLRISEDGGTVRLDDAIDNISAIPVGTVLNADGTTGVNYALRRHTPTSAVVQPVQTETNIGTWSAHVPVTPPTRILKELRVRFAQPATGIRFTLRAASSNTQTDGIILFQSHTDAEWNNGSGYSVIESPVGAPENFSVVIDRSAKVIENTILYVVVEQNTQGTGDIELRGINTTIGGVTGFFAYLEQDYVLEAQDLIPLASNVPLPSLHEFSINIASRVDLNTDLNVQQTLTFDTTGHSQFTALELIVTAGTNQTLTLPTTDGLQSQSVTLTGIDTSSQGSVTFQLSGTHSGGTVTSNVVTISVRDLAPEEFTYVNSQTDRLPANFTIAGANSQEFRTPQTIAVPTYTNSEYIVIAQPQAEADITSLMIGGLEQFSTFEKVVGTAMVGGVTYELYYSINPLIGSVVSGTEITINRG